MSAKTNVENLAIKRAQAEAENADAQANADSIRLEFFALKQRLTKAETERTSLAARKEVLQARLAELNAKQEGVKARHSQASAENASLKAQHKALEAERNQAAKRLVTHLVTLKHMDEEA